MVITRYDKEIEKKERKGEIEREREKKKRSIVVHEFTWV